RRLGAVLARLVRPGFQLVSLADMGHLHLNIDSRMPYLSGDFLFLQWTGASKSVAAEPLAWPWWPWPPKDDMLPCASPDGGGGAECSHPIPRFPQFESK